MRDRAWSYARVSTDEQREKGYSLPEQQGKLEGLCTGLGLKHLRHVEDDFTGTVRERPGLSAVLAAAEAGEFDVLACVRLDRLGRYNYIRRGIEVDLERWGIEVLYADHKFDHTSTGDFQRGIMGEMYEYEIRLLREKTMTGRLAKARIRGAYPCGVRIFGYKTITKSMADVIPECRGRDGQFLIRDEEAEWVRRIFEWCAGEGMTLRGISRRLHESGVATAKGGHWGASCIHNILTNRAYVGVMEYSGLEVETPALIDEAIFDRAQQVLGRNRVSRSGRPAARFALAGSVFCANCVGPRSPFGRRLCGHRGEGNLYYSCSSRIDVQRGCGVSARADVLEQAFLSGVRELLDPDELAAMLQRLDVSPKSRSRETIRADVDKTFLEEEGVADMVAAGISETVWRKKLTVIHENRLNLEQELSLVASDARAQRAESLGRRMQQYGGATDADFLAGAVQDFRMVVRSRSEYWLEPI